MLSDSQIFVVVDIEADGPAVGLNSMLSLAAVATTSEKEISHFYRKLTTLPGASQDPNTMTWWQDHPEAWTEANANAQSPEVVIVDFYDWVTNLRREPIFVSNPTSLDYTFVSWYLFRYALTNPFKNAKNHDIRALDIKSYIAGKYDLSFDKAKRIYWPKELTATMPTHTHNALDDAIGYAVLLRNLFTAEGD